MTKHTDIRVGQQSRAYKYDAHWLRTDDLMRQLAIAATASVPKVMKNAGGSHFVRVTDYVPPPVTLPPFAWAARIDAKYPDIAEKVRRSKRHGL